MRLLDHAYNEVNECDVILIARTVDDISHAKTHDKIALVLCLEGASPLEDELSCLRNFHRLGLRSLGLTHNWRNSLADGALERSGGGLTYFGMDVIKECNSLGIVVDVAHLSDKGIEDVLETSTHPIISSHANARSICPHVRNLTDDQIKNIAWKGGVIGVHAINFLISQDPQPSIDDLVKHIAHLAEIGGVDCVGIGPDLMEDWQEEIHKSVTEGAPKFASIPVKSISYSYPKGFRSLAEFPNLTQNLLRSGFSKEDVRKILGGNFLRVYKQVWNPTI
jgi:membrane dipeptidase